VLTLYEDEDIILHFADTTHAVSPTYPRTSHPTEVNGTIAFNREFVPVPTGQALLELKTEDLQALIQAADEFNARHMAGEAGACPLTCQVHDAVAFARCQLVLKLADAAAAAAATTNPENTP